MTRFRSGVARLSVLALTATVAAGCDTVGPGGTGNVRVTMQKIASATATQALVDGFASAADGSYPPIDVGNVESFTVQITSIEFLSAVEGASEDWISLPFPGVDLDLMALPHTFSAPLVIAAGDVDAGPYKSVRLRVGVATIEFKMPVSVGAFTFEAGGSITVTIPSGEQTGLKTDMAFTVLANADGNPLELTLLFDPDATFQNATATGSGKVILTPVLRN